MKNKKIPKNCLTCKFMEFLDDDCESMKCSIDDETVNDEFICGSYELSKEVEEDAKQGCW